MTTESKTNTPQDTAGPSRATPLQRVGRVGLDILNPLSDLKVLYGGVKPTLGRLSDLRERLRRSRTTQESLTWAQAVEKSGQSVEQLARGYRRSRYLSWSVMMLTGGLSLTLLGLLVAVGFDLPEAPMHRAFITLFVLTTVFAVSLTKVLKTNYRLWQLINQRVSLDEGGTFAHYKAENKMWLQLVTLRSE